MRWSSIGFVVAGLLCGPESALGSVFILAPTNESLTIECRGERLYFSYQLDDLPACDRYGCMTIEASIDEGEWQKYSAHNSTHIGFMRSMRDSFKRNGDVSETLLDRMLSASVVTFRNPGNGKIIPFPVSVQNHESLRGVARSCCPACDPSVKVPVTASNAASQEPKEPEAAPKPSPSREMIGVWRFSPGGDLEWEVELYRQGGRVYEYPRYDDGSGSPIEVKESKHPEGTKYADPSDRHGEYWVLLPNGDLAAYGPSGRFGTATRIR